MEDFGVTSKNQPIYRKWHTRLYLVNWPRREIGTTCIGRYKFNYHVIARTKKDKLSGETVLLCDMPLYALQFNSPIMKYIIMKNRL